MKRLIVGLLVLAGLLVAVDFGAAAFAEAAVSRQMRQEIGLPRDPAVRINGFPFVTQAAAGRYSSIDVTTDRLDVGPLQEVEVVVHLVDVRAPGGLRGDPATLQVRELDSTVRVGANDLERLVAVSGEDVERMRIESVDSDALEQLVEDGADPAVADLDPDTLARLVGTVEDLPDPDDPTAEQEGEVAVLVVLDLSDGQVRIAPQDVRRNGDDEPLPAEAAQAFGDLFAVTVDPGALPLGVRPTTVEARDGVIQVSGTARNVDLAPAQPTAG